ncbi:MAG: hypothetical protein OEV01_05945 [Nitrospira sp.]|nr:hypothetical protein [Nitrospira sp.]MDH5195306.1 hypothetical protein [Nitrospira sp.]
MARHPSMVWDDHRRYLAVVILSLGAIGFTAILSFSAEPVFQPFFRNIPPLLAVSITGVLGVVSLGFLSSRGWFEMYSRQESLRGVAWSSAFATLFAVPIILIDLTVVFPYQHVPPPQSLLFYPTMAYVAEIVFHILPLSIILALLGPLFKGRDSTKLLWLYLVLASCPEPIFQLGWSSLERPLSWVEVYVGLHVFAFNVLELSVFRRYDFVSMYTCRLVYYLYWHVMWGSVRQYLLSG